MSTTLTATSHRSHGLQRFSRGLFAVACAIALIAGAHPAAAQGRGSRVSKDLVEHLAKAARGEADSETVDVIVSGNSDFVARIARKHGASVKTLAQERRGSHGQRRRPAGDGERQRSRRAQRRRRDAIAAGGGDRIDGRRGGLGRGDRQDWRGHRPRRRRGDHRLGRGRPLGAGRPAPRAEGFHGRAAARARTSTATARTSPASSPPARRRRTTAKRRSAWRRAPTSSA